MKILYDNEMEEPEKNKTLLSKKAKSIEDQEDVDTLIDTYFFNEFYKTKSSEFLKKVIDNQRSIDTRLLKKTRRSLNHTPKTIKVIQEIQEKPPLRGKKE